MIIKYIFLLFLQQQEQNGVKVWRKPSSFLRIISVALKFRSSNADAFVICKMVKLVTELERRIYLKVWPWLTEEKTFELLNCSFSDWWKTVLEPVWHFLWTSYLSVLRMFVLYSLPRVVRLLVRVGCLKGCSVALNVW